MVTRYVDLVNGNDSNDGSTFALRKKTLSSAGSGLTAGDEIRVMASPAATSTGINATWTNGSDVVTLASSLTKTVDNCEAAWTAAANVTATASTTTYRQGTASASLVIATAFTTGLVAYRALGSTVDFSGYQQLSLLIRPTAAVAANVLSLRLCSDTAGATVVNSVNIPALASGEWHKVVIDTGGTLGSAILSVSLSASSDPGSLTVFLDNILACKAASAADSLTHRSLIRKTGSSDAWFSIESIDDTTVILSGVSLSTAAKSTLINGKYWGSTATVGLDKREPIVLSSQQTFSTNTSGNPNTSYITISGGWDTTNMSTQTDRTYLCHGQPSVSLLSISGSKSRLSAFGASDVGSSNAGFSINSCIYVTLTDCVAANCGYAVSLFNANGCAASLPYSVHNRVTFYMSGTVLGDSNNVSATLYAGYAWGTANTFNQPSYLYYNISTSTPFRPLLECPDARYHSRGVFSQGNETLTIRNTVFTDCYTDVSMGTDAYAYNTTFASDTLSSGIGMDYAVLYAQQINGDPTKHGQCSGFGWKVLTATDQRRTASDVSWKFTALNNALYFGYTHPSLCVAQVVCLAGQTRSVSLWFRKDHVNVAMRLRVKGGFVSGIPNDVVANMTVGINTWEQLTVSFTPTYDCIVPVYAEFTGPTSCNGWVDDLSLS
jgi:hypothetical protein